MEHQMLDNKKAVFPFSAVQGQPLFKLALLLSTVNPALGGVLISGPSGSGKSTLARAVAELLPAESEHEPKFVTLPLQATTEMLVGSLHVDHSQKNSGLAFKPGLLKKANGGVLYVDQVNLLADKLADQLLDVTTSGSNVVALGEFTHRHDACFTLIATMNPEEGKLRAQMLDRFAFMVLLDNDYSVQQRINIIKTSQAFEQNPEDFCDRFQVKQIVLQQQISDAQALLPGVICSEEMFVEIATRCQQANVKGLRADIMLHRASITHAAWCGRSEVVTEDINQVAPLVLLHRQQRAVTFLDSSVSTDNSILEGECEFSHLATHNQEGQLTPEHIEQASVSRESVMNPSPDDEAQHIDFIDQRQSTNLPKTPIMQGLRDKLQRK